MKVGEGQAFERRGGLDSSGESGAQSWGSCRSSLLVTSIFSEKLEYCLRILGRVSEVCEE